MLTQLVTCQVLGRTAAEILTLVGAFLAACGCLRAGEQAPPNYLIVPGVGIAAFKLGMSKDDMIRKLGDPMSIFDCHQKNSRGISRNTASWTLKRNCLMWRTT